MGGADVILAGAQMRRRGRRRGRSPKGGVSTPSSSGGKVCSTQSGRTSSSRTTSSVLRRSTSRCGLPASRVGVLRSLVNLAFLYWGRGQVIDDEVSRGPRVGPPGPELTDVRGRTLPRRNLRQGRPVLVPHLIPRPRDSPPHPRLHVRDNLGDAPGTPETSFGDIHYHPATLLHISSLALRTRRNEFAEISRVVIALRPTLTELDLWFNSHH